MLYKRTTFVVRVAKKMIMLMHFNEKHIMIILQWQILDIACCLQE